jgi:hypothetical protein
MGTVTAYDMASIQSALGGSNPIGLNEYYRGGSFVPTTASSSTREPASGDYFTQPSYWWASSNTSGSGSNGVYWGGLVGFVSNATSLTVGSTTYFRGNFRFSNLGCPCDPYVAYGIFRTVSSTVSINTGVPSSGQISISQLYGARNP